MHTNSLVSLLKYGVVYSVHENTPICHALAYGQYKIVNLICGRGPLLVLAHLFLLLRSLHLHIESFNRLVTYQSAPHIKALIAAWELKLSNYCYRAGGIRPFLLSIILETLSPLSLIKLFFFQHTFMRKIPTVLTLSRSCYYYFSV